MQGERLDVLFSRPFFFIAIDVVDGQQLHAMDIKSRTAFTAFLKIVSKSRSSCRGRIIYSTVGVNKMLVTCIHAADDAFSAFFISVRKKVSWPSTTVNQIFFLLQENCENFIVSSNGISISIKVTWTDITTQIPWIPLFGCFEHNRHLFLLLFPCKHKNWIVQKKHHQQHRKMFTNFTIA